LSSRDRGIVTVAAPVARSQTAEMVTLDRHLAFCVGWPNVFSAVPVTKGVFDGRTPLTHP